MDEADDREAADAAGDEALAWLIRVQSDQASADDWAALTQWLEGSPERQAAFDRAEALSADLDLAAPAILAALDRPAADILPFRPRPPHRRPPPVAAGLAAACALAAILLGPVAWRSYVGTTRTYATGRGETRSLELADGSRIVLDSTSRLSVRLGWRERRIELGEGEASFDVAKDPHRPFIVAVGDERVRVVGTEFNISHFDHATLITVRRGVVEVDQPSTGAKPIARLTKGWALSHIDGAATSTSLMVNPDNAFAWVQGRLVCRDEPLSQIVAYLNRRYRTPIQLSARAASRRFTGVLEIGDEADAVRRLSIYLSLHVDRAGGGIVLD